MLGRRWPMGANICPKYEGAGGSVEGPDGIPTPIQVMESETRTQAPVSSPRSHSRVLFIVRDDVSLVPRSLHDVLFLEIFA